MEALPESEDIAMKFCDLTQFYCPTGGGIRTYITEKQKYIKEHLPHCHLLIVPGEKDRFFQENNISSYQVAAGRIPKSPSYRFIFRMDKVISILNKEKPDLIELGSPYVLPFAAFSYQKKNNCVLAGFYHTDFPSAYVEKAFRLTVGKTLARRAEKLAESYVRFIYSRFNVTLASSAFFQQKLQKIGIQRVRLLSMGVDLGLFHPNKRDQQLRKKIGVEDDDILLIYCGRLDQEKKTNILMQAFGILAPTFKGKLLLIGEGPLKKNALEEARRNEKILVLPYQSDKALLAKYLASSDIYVTAGPHETFGLSVIEAQACGLPAVGVNAGALKERITHGVGLLGPVDSAKDLALNISNLTRMEMKIMGNKARQLVEKDFSWKKTFTLLFDLYEKLFKQKAAENEDKKQLQAE